MKSHSSSPDTTKPSRQLLRFSIRTLLLFTAVIACWLGWQVDKAHKQQAAVAAIEAVGGSASYIDQWDYGWREPIVRYLGHAYLSEPVQVRFVVMAPPDDTVLKHLHNLPAGSSLTLDHEEDVARCAQLLPHFGVYRHTWDCYLGHIHEEPESE